MEILGQTPVQSILFFVLFGVTGVVPLLAALYLLLRPYNTFSADIKAAGAVAPLDGGVLRLHGIDACVVAAVHHLLPRP